MITDGKQHKARLLDIIILRIEIVGGAVASRWVRSTPDRAVRVRDLAGDIALCSYTSLSQCLSPPRCIMGTGKFNAGGNPAMD